MKMGNIASLDPAITSTGRKGLRATPANERAMWDEMTSDWESFAVECEQDLLATEVIPETVVEQTMPDYDVLPVGEDQIVRATTRIGQRLFRAAVMSAYNEQCCITGLAIPQIAYRKPHRTLAPRDSQQDEPEEWLTAVCASRQSI